MSFFPLDRDLLTSSTWAMGSPEATKVWIYLLLQANPRTGIVEDAAPAIAMRCGLPLDKTVEALNWLASPDPYSRTKDLDGRRVEPLETGGYRLVNYLSRQKKDHSTVRVRKWRDMKRDETMKRVSSVAETTEKETDKDKVSRKEANSYLPPPTERAERALDSTVRSLQLRLGALIAQLSEHPESRQMVADWSREVTAYEKADGTKVRGVPDWRTLFSIDRLERSISDAEWHLAELDKRGAKGAKQAV